MARAQRKTKEIATIQESLMGKISGTKFHNAANGYTIIACEDATNGLPFVAVGHMASVRVGDEFRFKGAWKEHPQWGKQFAFSEAEVILPIQKDGILAWFASVARGVGEVRANEIYNKLGANCLEIIKEGGAETLVSATANSPHRITIEMATEIHDALTTNAKLAQLTAMIAGDGLSAGTAARVYAKMGADCINKIKQNPYILADEMHGIGFKKADAIAQKLGVEANSPFRYQSAAKYALTESSTEGHCYLSPSELIAKVKVLLGRGCAMTMSDLRLACSELERQKSVILDTSIKAVYKRSLYSAEVNLAGLLRNLLFISDRFANNIDDLLREIQEATGTTWNESQEEAVRMAINKPLCIITGGPGTGKTTITKGIIEADRITAAFRSTYLASPTGRAAKRLGEATGMEATTIHRLLGFIPVGEGEFQHDDQNQLPPGRFIIDEASMMDISLANSLFQAIPHHPDTQVVIVGDIDQLPSVGPGSVLRDMIESKIIPTIRLSYNYRQEQGGKIPSLAAQVVEGSFPNMEASKDYLPVVVESQDEALEEIKKAVNQCCMEGLGVMDYQVLAPMYRGVCGVDNINTDLQELLNPMSEEKTEIETIKRIFRSGDKVLVLKNDYSKGVFNGDQGIITEALSTGVHVSFEDKLSPVFFPRDDLGKLALAYCTTVHKSQGSEYKVVVMALLQSHYIMLKRNLFYTGITRAAERLVLIHQEAAVKTAAVNEDTERRNSRLKERLVAERERVVMDTIEQLPEPQSDDNPF